MPFVCIFPGSVPSRVFYHRLRTLRKGRAAICDKILTEIARPAIIRMSFCQNSWNGGFAMAKLLRKLPRLTVRNLVLLFIILWNLIYLYSHRCEGIWKLLSVCACGGGMLLYQFVRRRILWDRFTVCLAACCGFVWLSSLLNQGLSLHGALYSACLSVYVLLPAVSLRDSSPRALRRETTSLAVLVVCVLFPFMLLGVASVLMRRPIHLPLMPKRIGIRADGLPNARIRVLGHPNISGWDALTGVLLSIYLLHQTRRKSHRCLLAAAILAFSLALSHTQSRSSIYALCACVGAIAFHFFYLKFRSSRGVLQASLGVWFVTFVATLALLLTAFSLDIQVAQALSVAPPNAALAEDAAAEELWEADEVLDESEREISRFITDGPTNVTENGRGEIWRAAFRYFRNHPLHVIFGMGNSKIPARIAAEAGSELTVAFHHLHNSLLELLARGGIFALLGLLGALVLLVRPACKLLLLPDAEGDRGAYLLPILVGGYLMISLVDCILFATIDFKALLFFFAAGRIMRLEREGKLNLPH